MNQPAKQNFNPPAPQAENPIAMAPPVQAGGAMAEIEQSRAVAEIQASMVVANRFPRDHRLCLDRVLLACQRPALAEVSQYSYARGGTKIEGASIKLAKAIAQNWKHLHFGIRVLERRPTTANRVGESTIEAFAWDLENNTKEVRIFQLPHWRDTKGGGYAIKEERDIYELEANMGARRLRACILGIIPGDVVEAAIDQCESTLRQMGKEVTPDSIKAMVEAFAEYGITAEQIQKRIQRNIDAIDAPLMISLGKIRTSLKDGMSQPKDWFEMPTPEAQAAAAAEAAKQATGGDAGKQAEDKAAAAGGGEAPSDWDTVIDDELKPGVEAAKTVAELDAFLQDKQPRIAEISASKNKKAIDKWARMVSAKRTALKEGKLNV